MKWTDLNFESRPIWRVLLIITDSFTPSLSYIPFDGLVGTGVINQCCGPSSSTGYALNVHSSGVTVVGTWIEYAYWHVVVGTVDCRLTRDQSIL